MMSAEGSKTIVGHRHNEGEHKHKIIEVSDEFRQQFWQVIEGYLTLQMALAANEASEAGK